MRIYTDGRTLPEINERWPTYTGESVGTWDQEVLVFTTVSMIGEKSTVLDRSGLTLSDQAEISTRLFRMRRDYCVQNCPLLILLH